ncbi:MAG: UvrD-helicase domain-containing protein [Huintestinicola sp.]|uniref:UvrD-helicase domain-containing protein n=1 Tax=Huintestinicola sp. TaxID=2981661 RepID=UPI003F0107FE
MAPNWTPEQCAAINVKNRAAVVSAAAGSGKTAVLVEKLLRILSDRNEPVSADRIVVVTFTNDAAAQMKQRLCAKLAEAAEQDPENDWLVSQQALIPSAKISTIHSFCFDMIRGNSALIDADSGFRVLDQSEDDAISARAAENVFDRWFAERSEDMKRLTDFFCPDSRNDERLAAVIPPLRSKLLALPFPEDRMNGIAAAYEHTAEILGKCCSEAVSEERKNELLCDPLISYYLKNSRVKLAKALDSLTAAADMLIGEYEKIISEIILQTSGSDEKPYADTLSSIEKAKGIITVLEGEKNSAAVMKKKLEADLFFPFSGEGLNVTARLTLSKSFKYKVKPAGAKKAESYTAAPSQEVLDKGKKLRAESLDTVKKLSGRYTLSDLFYDFNRHGEICRLLFALMSDIFAEEKLLRSEKNALSFSDAEQLAVELLCSRDESGNISPTPLAKELSDYFHIVMIDEFQDSTAVQELIFRMLSKGGSADAPGTNFFAVGDVKQSIYRFRCSDPTIFLANIRDSVDYKDDGSCDRARIYLNRNFRSSHGVVEFVNAVFESIMSEENGSVLYDDTAKLIEGAGIGDIYGPTEIITLPPSVSPEENEEEETQDSEENGSLTEDDGGLSSLDIIEAKCTAVRIKELLENEKIEENGELRAVRPSDICILMRGVKKAGIYVSCLEELGISVQGPAEESYLGSREIAVLINLLRCIDNCTLDVPMASVLMSPMFMFTAEDMARLRVKRSSSVYNDVLLSSMGKKDVPEKLKRQCKDFLDVFGRLREYAAVHTAAELIEFIYSRTDFMAVVSVYKDSAKKKANLRLLPIYAEKFDKNGSGGLSGFLHFIDSMLRNKKDFQSASAVSSVSDSVSIKTIHKSKGLEYPFVFLCRSFVKFNLRDTSGRIVFSPFPDGSGSSVGFRITDGAKYAVYESFPREVLSEMLKKSQRDEEMMLLYVALTRAKYKLFITRRNDSEPISAKRTVADRRRELAELIVTTETGCDCREAVGECMCMEQWLDVALSLFENGENSGEKIRGECRVMFTEGKISEETASDENAVSPAALPDESRAKILRENLSCDYDDTLSVTASKLTVSEIAKKHEPKLRRFFGETARKKAEKKAAAGISAADRGTAVHEFMQYCDITKLAAVSPEKRDKAISEEAARLCRTGHLTEIQAKCADPEMIGQFLDSELCGRIIRSENVMRERKFLVKIADLCIDEEILDNSGLRVYNNTEGMLQGVADLLFEEDGRMILVDYKTDRYITPEQLKARYSMQLYLYAKALSLILGKPVSEAYLYSFELGAAVKTELSPENIII